MFGIVKEGLVAHQAFSKSLRGACAVAISSIRKAALLGLPAPGTRLPRSAHNDNCDFEKARLTHAAPV